MLEYIILVIVAFCRQLLVVNGQYVFTTKANLVTAVDAWVADEAAATATYGDINNWDVSAVTDMSDLFKDKTTFNSDISGWDVGGVTTMNSMFISASAFNQNISGWNVTSATTMAYMFYGVSAFNQDISGWNVGSVTTMYRMF